MQGKELIKHICTQGTPAQKRALFEFADEPIEKVLAKFQLFSRTFFLRYFQQKSAPFHKTMAENYLRSYLLNENRMELGFRGCAKTSLLELVIVFVLLNDTKARKKYVKILSRDLKNSVKLVTGIYNKLIELQPIYGDVFIKEGKKKQEERQDSFVMEKGVQLSAGTVGQSQRGHKQDAYRPDWLVFEDIEDRTSVSSQAITTTTIENCDEALTGGAIEYSIVVNGNYISEDGVIEWFKKMSSIQTNITPIRDKAGEPTWEAITKDMIAELQSKSLDFAGEYDCDPQRSGSKYFDVDRIARDLMQCTKPSENIRGGRFWAKYIPSNSYGIGADTSEGKGLDSCAYSLWDFTTGTLVGAFNDNQIRPDMFAYELVRLGNDWGGCILAPEINNTSGGMVIQVLKDKEYPNIYRKQLTDRLNNVLTNQLGWHTNSKTKPQILAEFARDYGNGLIKILDEAVLKEMRAFNVNDMDDQPATALATRHFDLLMSCFVENTMILTDQGQRPIQDLQVGDKVMTRKGYKKIISTRSVVKPVISNIGLTGTADHPVILADGSIKELTRVSHGDKLYIWDSKQQKIEILSYTKAQPITVTPTHQNETTASTIPVEQSGKSQLSIYIDKFGLTTMGKYQLATKYITKTVTHLITALQTWKQSLRQTICAYTCKTKRERMKSERLLKTTDQKLTPQSEKALKKDQSKQKLANGVQTNLNQFHSWLNSVRALVCSVIRVNKKRNHTYQERASFVQKNSSLVFHIKRDVQLSANQRDEENLQRVYNIEVEDQPEYVANNILVHNCAIGWAMRKHAIPAESDEDDELWGDYSFAQV